MKEITNVTIGADPEVFLINKETNKHISAIGLFPGNKDAPSPITEEGHGILTDNVAAEFVIPPSRTKEDFYKHIMLCMNWIRNNCPKELTISDKVSVEFDADQLDNDMACEFGCSVDYNVYTGNQNDAPSGYRTNLRSVGSHIHVGWSKPTNDQREAVVKAIDLFVTLPMVLMEEPNKRRELYGKAGAFRPKEYGIESRSPSSAWIMSKDTIEWTFEQTMKAIEWINKGNSMDLIDELKLVQAINTYDKEVATELCNKYNISVLELVND